MLKSHKKTLILTSLLTLLPIVVGLLLWNQFPEKMITHWGITGEADGWSSIPFAVFAPPLLMLATLWLCVFFTAKDPGNQNRNKKPLNLVLWIIPIISNLSSYLMYALALGMELSVEKIMIFPLGLMFSVIGNYLPKCKTNSTIGIRVPWTFSSEENWYATHRFGGRVWLIGGILMALSAFLPEDAGILVMVISMITLCVLPIAYSYAFYRRQKASGDALNAFPKSGKVSIAALVIVLLLVAAVLFVGNIAFQFREDYLLIDTDLYSDHVVYYDAIEAVEYREGNVSGMRVGGYGSFRLLMGYFKNDEFGTYVRYTYYKPDACVVLTLNEKTLVLSGETKEATEAIYQELVKRVSN